MSASPPETGGDRATLLRMAADPKTPPELLGAFARRHVDDLELCLSVARNPAAADDTLVFLARHAHPAVLQTIIEETSLLERVRGIREELLESAPGDEAGAEGEGQAAGRLRAKALNHAVRTLSIEQKLVLADQGSRALRLLLIRDANPTIAMATLLSPRMTDMDILVVANMRDVSEKILRAIAEDRRYKANRYIAWALLTNPKTPVPVSLGLGLSNLTDKELGGLGRNRNIPAAVSRAARGLLLQRAREGKKPQGE